MNQDTRLYAKRIFIAAGITALLVSIILLFIETVQVFLLIFTGILFAIFLRGIAKFINRFIPISINIALIITIILLFVFIIGGGMLLGPSITEGFQGLGEQIPSAVEKLEEEISKFGLGEKIIEGIKKSNQEILSDPKLASRITGIFSTTAGAFFNFLVIMIIGIYSAFEPDLYKKGFLKLFPKSKRDTADEVLSSLSHALGWWLVGRFISMLIVGILTTIGLSILGIPLAFTLGILAAFLDFIPNFGPIIAAIPAVLIALVQGPSQALYVMLLYLAVQSLEGYLIAPLVEKKTVQMPPAILISAQILMGLLLGILGLLLASPIIVVIIVIVQITYIKNTLGEKVEILGKK